MYVLLALLLYFLLLLTLSRRTSRRSGGSDVAFFRGGTGGAPWGMVAVGMVGASISGVTFISVPAWAASTGLTYLQMCAGFALGYVVVATVLLPVYYRLRLTSIYTYLGTRFGPSARHTGAAFFVLSKLTGAAARLFAVCLVMHVLLGGSFVALSGGVVLLIWLYTRRAGLATVIRTDVVQTVALVLAAVVLVACAIRALGTDFGGACDIICQSPMARLVETDLRSPMAWPKQLVSGIFVVVAMTGLDQDMMQKNLACRSLRAAQKNMCSYGLAFLPVNALFLCLGILLYTLCAQQGIAAPSPADALLPTLIQTDVLGTWAAVAFAVGVAAAAFSSADSAMTALTTTICIDLGASFQVFKFSGSQAWGKFPLFRVFKFSNGGLGKSPNEMAKPSPAVRAVHLGVAVCIWLLMQAFYAAGTSSAIDLIYTLCSYTYGPLLGLYGYGLLTRRSVRDGAVPLICLASPLLCAALDHWVPLWTGYRFGYELLLLNGLLTAAMLYASGCALSRRQANGEGA